MITTGFATNPAANAVIADTGQLPDSSPTNIIIGFSNLATAAAVFIIRAYDANNAVVFTHYWVVPANSSNIWETAEGSVIISQGLSIRVVTQAAVTGSVSACISLRT